MTGTNHILAGALIGTTLGQPVAIPVAFASHFVLDIMPHYGNDTVPRMRRVLQYDAILSITLLITLVTLTPHHWLLMLTCALASILPDAIWIPYELANRRKKPREYKRIAKFLHDIQWGERPWGLAIEIPVACVLLIALRIVS